MKNTEKKSKIYRKLILWMFCFKDYIIITIWGHPYNSCWVECFIETLDFVYMFRCGCTSGPLHTVGVHLIVNSKGHSNEIGSSQDILRCVVNSFHYRKTNCLSVVKRVKLDMSLSNSRRITLHVVMRYLVRWQILLVCFHFIWNIY